jgi:hypothetical protein
MASTVVTHRGPTVCHQGHAAPLLGVESYWGQRSVLQPHILTDVRHLLGMDDACEGCLSHTVAGGGRSCDVLHAVSTGLGSCQDRHDVLLWMSIMCYRAPVVAATVAFSHAHRACRALLDLKICSAHIGTQGPHLQVY